MARTAHKRHDTKQPTTSGNSARDARDHLAQLSIDALQFCAADRIERTMQQWLAGAEPPSDSRLAQTLAEMSMLSADIAVFTPSVSGQTAIDRLLRSRKPLGPDDAAAAEALRHAQFRILRLGTVADGVTLCRDLATDQAVHLADDRVPPDAAGMVVAMRTVPFGPGVSPGAFPGAPSGAHIAAGPVIALDEAGLQVAQGFMRSNNRGLSNGLRCAEALCRHVIRHGGPAIRGLTPGLPDDFDLTQFPIGPDESELDAIAHAWEGLAADAAPPPDQVRAVRSQVSAESVVDLLATSALARNCNRPALADAYARAASIQMEALHRRKVSGMTTDGLDAVRTILDKAVADDMVPAGALPLFDRLRLTLSVAPASRGGAHAADLDKLVQRIQALRAKTVEQGCTEQEALAAAQKVAELVDRHGLSLSELELREQNCEGTGIDTGRRRFGPIDQCVPAIADFFDSRAWVEKASNGELRYIFFGFPADIAAAHYLYDLIDHAFETETRLFKAGDVYADVPSRDRRTATTSFQTGLAQGIRSKLDTLRQAREAELRSASGRDLVPVKEAVVDDELAKLGLNLRQTQRSTRRYVLSDAFEAGQDAGARFEYRPGIGHET